MIHTITQILKKSDTTAGVIPPTELYNETWMLRLTLDWFSQQPRKRHPLSFRKDARWYSELLLPSQFLATFRRDPLSESYTHADGAIGHFSIGRSGKGDINLSEKAKQLVIIEAKMFSKLSRGVSHAKNFDQAARTVSCIG